MITPSFSRFPATSVTVVRRIASICDVVHKQDFIVTTAVIQLEQPAGDAAFHLMGSIANGVLLYLRHHASVVAGG